MRRLALFAAGCIAACPAVATEQVLRMPFSAPVTVSADGSTEVGGIEGLPTAVGEVVRTALGELPYVVASRDGEPVASTVQVDGEVLLLPRGAEFEVAIEGLQAQPRLLAWRPADYPLDAMRERETGSVAFLLDVGSDGRVRDSTLVQGLGKQFVAAARDALADWRFQPPVEGEAFQVGATFWFHANWAEPRMPDEACTVPPRAAHLPGDSGCLRITETTGAVLTRAEVRQAPPGAPPRVPHLVRPPAPPSAGGRWPDR